MNVNRSLHNAIRMLIVMPGPSGLEMCASTGKLKGRSMDWLLHHIACQPGHEGCMLRNIQQ